MKWVWCGQCQEHIPDVIPFHCDECRGKHFSWVHQHCKRCKKPFPSLSEGFIKGECRKCEGISIKEHNDEIQARRNRMPKKYTVANRSDCKLGRWTGHGHSNG